MTQSEVTTYLSDKIGISRAQAKKALDEINLLVVRELKKEGTIRLGGLGAFTKRRTKARIGRNPTTGEEIKIPARTKFAIQRGQVTEGIGAWRFEQERSITDGETIIKEEVGRRKRDWRDGPILSACSNVIPGTAELARLAA